MDRSKSMSAGSNCGGMFRAEREKGTSARFLSQYIMVAGRTRTSEAACSREKDRSDTVAHLTRYTAILPRIEVQVIHNREIFAHFSPSGSRSLHRHAAPRYNGNAMGA